MSHSMTTSIQQFETALWDIYNIFLNEYNYRMSDEFSVRLKEQIQQIHLNPDSDKRLHELFKKITTELDRLQDLLNKLDKKNSSKNDE